MPSLIDIRRRVRAVKSTQQITKAMKMVSSSKLRRAQERIVKSRPYAKEMLRVFNNLATRTENATHPLLNDDPESGRTLLIVITADRGLCGSFNTNVAKVALQFTLEQPKDPRGRDVAMALVGRKGPRLLHAPRLRRALRGGRPVPEREVGARAGHRADRHQGIPGTGRQLRVPRL
jgi:F-type H+-transporting ATPase subunit gamma